LEVKQKMASLRDQGRAAEPRVNVDVVAASKETVLVGSTDEVTTTEEVPSHRSHDPKTNRRKVDPFMFGQRLLEDADNVFEYNAWDHVEPDEAFYEYAEKQYEMQRQSPVSDFDKSKSIGDLSLPSRHNFSSKSGVYDDLHILRHRSSEHDDDHIVLYSFAPI
jgi:hypothetical protein